MSNFNNVSTQMTPVYQATNPASTKSLIHPNPVTATHLESDNPQQVFNVNITMNVTGNANFFGTGAMAQQQAMKSSIRKLGQDHRSRQAPGQRTRRQRPMSGASHVATST